LTLTNHLKKVYAYNRLAVVPGVTRDFWQEHQPNLSWQT
jgi:hypothetical protein